MSELEQEVHEDEELTAFGIAEVILDTLRIAAIVAAMVFVAFGAYLAYDFYFFVRGIVSEPERIVRVWVDIAAKPESEATAVIPKESPAHESVEAITPVPHSAGAGVDGAAEASTSADGVVASPTQPVPPAAQSDSEEDRRRMARPADPDPWLTFGEKVLEHVETGDLGWVAGMAFLVAFCWIVGKIPALILTTGTKVMVDLFKIGRE